MTSLKVGSKLSSAVSGVQVMIIRSSLAEADLRCGGVSMLAQGESAASGVTLDSSLTEGVATGKRYTDPAGQIELLCVKGGEGTITLDGEPLGPRLAKKLPSSD